MEVEKLVLHRRRHPTEILGSLFHFDPEQFDEPIVLDHLPDPLRLVHFCHGLPPIALARAKLARSEVDYTVRDGKHGGCHER